MRSFLPCFNLNLCRLEHKDMSFAILSTFILLLNKGCKILYENANYFQSESKFNNLVM